jgi:hypothetical protein
LRDSPESIAAGELAHPELAKTTIVRTILLSLWFFAEIG